MYRWLPKYEFVVDYYEDEYRFSPDTNDVYGWKYNTKDVATFTLEKTNSGNYISLQSAIPGLTTLSSFGMIMFTLALGHLT